MIIGIIGPTTFQKKKKVKDLIFNIKKTIPDAKIASGGNKEGIEYEVKKHALMFELEYLEFNPSYTGYNLYSALNESYYGKGYHFTQELDRYMILVRQSDRIIFGYEPESKEWKQIYSQIVKYASKLNKKIKFI